MGMGLVHRHPVAVSIHTRHFWRVNRLMVVRLFLLIGFNPHPPFLAGESGGKDGSRNMGSFNPHPPFLAGEYSWAGKVQAQLEFQSTPAISGG